MGLDIDEYPIMDGLVTLKGLYGNARQIRITKDDETSVYSLECLFFIYKGKKLVETLHIMKDYKEDILTKTWEDVYTLIKEKLDTLGIKYNNNI